MSREIVDQARIWCDGCGVAVIETVADDLDKAAWRSGWLVTVRADTGTRCDLCPMCRPDSPFAAIERIREVCGPGGGAFPSNDYVGDAVMVEDILEAISGSGNET